MFVDDKDTTENELEAEFKYLLLTSSSDISVFTTDTINLLNYNFVDNSNSPYLLCILKNPLKPKPTTYYLSSSIWKAYNFKKRGGEEEGGGVGSYISGIK